MDSNHQNLGNWMFWADDLGLTRSPPWPGYPFGNFFCLSCFLCDCIELLLSEDEAAIRLSVSSWPAGNSCSGLGSMYSSMSMLKEGLRVMWGTSSISSSSVAWKRQSWGNFHKISVVYSWIVTMNWCVALQLDKECPITFLPYCSVQTWRTFWYSSMVLNKQGNPLT